MYSYVEIHPHIRVSYISILTQFCVNNKEGKERMQTMKAKELVDVKAIQARAFVYWARRYRQDVLDMSFGDFGNYLTSFIQYLLKNYGDLLTEKDREKCKERLKGRLTEMVRGFEQEDRYSDRSMNEAWRKFFMLFCITGNVESDFDIFSYLNTGDRSLLPKNTWTRKEIPFGRAKNAQGASGDSYLAMRVEALEKQLAVLVTGNCKRMTETPPQTTFSALLADYVKKEMSDRAVTRDSVLIGLISKMNEQGGHFMRPELEFILDRADEMFYMGRLKAIIKRIAELTILLKEDEKPYSLSELLAMPLGFQVIQEEQSQRSR